MMTEQLLQLRNHGFNIMLMLGCRIADKIIESVKATKNKAMRGVKWQKIIRNGAIYPI